MKHTVENKIRTLLKMEIKLEQMLLEDGQTTVEFEMFEEGYQAFVVLDGERQPLPEGDYILQNGQQFMVDEMGTIVSIGALEPEKEQEMEKEPTAVEKEAKKVVESTTKETHFSEEEKLEVLFSDEQKTFIKELVKEVFTELSATEKKAEVVDKAEEPVKEEFSKPKKHSPEKQTENIAKVNFSKRPETTQSRIDRVLFSKN